MIGTSTVASAIGLVKRARWAAWSVAIFGASAAALLAVQPLFEPMKERAQQSIWLGAAAVGVVAACVSWFAHRLSRATNARTNVRVTERSSAESFNHQSRTQV